MTAHSLHAATSPAHKPGAPPLELRDVFRIYREQDIETVALRGANLTVAEGEFVAIVGRSGSGKSTLLHLAASLTLPSAGKTLVRGVDMIRLTEDERAAARRQHLGIVFQQNNLIPFLTARENVEVAMIEPDPAKRRAHATALLERVGLGARLRHRPATLSGGEQQRVAIAVALANQPTLLLADEITGELDSATADGVMRLLLDLNREQGMAIVLVTHNPAVAALASRRVQMSDGLLLPWEAPMGAEASVAASDSATASEGEVIVRANQLTKAYAGGLVALHAVSVSVRAGETLAVMGPSGCGKSTLLNLLGGLDRPSSGVVWINGQTLGKVNAEQLATMRRRTIGVVFQAHNLLPTLTAWENVAVPLLLDGVASAERRARALALLARVGLEAEAEKLPDQMSGGQRQRVAIARSLAHHPRVLLADEPTGALDSENADLIAGLLIEIAQEERIALILVTHDPVVAARCRRIMRLADGRQVAPESPLEVHPQSQTEERV
ncbi:MAG TPA: ATP-binding cassette domain-containing protein [Ktedonobacterales bacterium]|jgi:putative ABC transport system ATP-binding protein|nr:ATP-binding cassette domain-containing protein [Ktedonobacterales bacterium]